jgi:glyoxylase-like metal-dependent hydrolase (beta-lactamase superfamily II)
MTKIWTPIKLPLGNKSYLQDVTIYLIKSRDGFILLDAGLNTTEAFSSIGEAFSRIGCRPQDIRAIYITHYHLDHCGLATRLQDLLSVPIYMTKEDKEILDFIKTYLHEYPEKMGEFFGSFGVPHTTIDYLKKELTVYKQLLIGPDRIHPTIDGEKIEITSGHLKVVSTPGHTPGHISFLLPKEGILFGGDFFLRDEFPHVGIYPHTIKYNPLKDYLKTLEKIKAMDINIILPSHGEPIYDPGRRIDDVTGFIRHKIEDVLRLLKKGPLSLSQVCDQGFRSYDSGLSLSYFFILTLSLAYLRYLEEENLAVRKSNKSGIVFVA